MVLFYKPLNLIGHLELLLNGKGLNLATTFLPYMRSQKNHGESVRFSAWHAADILQDYKRPPA